MAQKTGSTVDRTESYLDNDIPFWIKLLFGGLILWGTIFALWFILGGYNSEKRFDARPAGGASVEWVADRTA